MKQSIERGRLKEKIAPEVIEVMIEPTLTQEEITRSYQLYLDVNKAHVLMLAKQKILAPKIASAILEATQEMAKMGNQPSFEISPYLEEMYFNLENHLIEMVGMEIGGQQHTARSRNDLHATVDRMETRNAIIDLCTQILSFRKDLITLAKKNEASVMSGYTHLQPSEPITLAHYLSAVSSALYRDYQRIIAAWTSTNLNPLGGGSMGSTTWDIDRNYTAKLLGFDGCLENSLDCVCSRDYLIQLMNAIAMLANTLSRVALDMRIWATPDYGYIEVEDKVAVCSSIMPQKKNPWTFETVCSMAARVKGYSDAAWMTYKGVPYAFTMESMDLISNFWPALKDIKGMLELMDVSLTGIKFNKERAETTAAGNFTTVTELANALVRIDGISFREAHEIVAHIVGYLTENKKKATEIIRTDLVRIGKELFGIDLKITDAQIQEALDPVKNAQSKTTLGGTAASEVDRQLNSLQEKLTNDEAELNKKKDGLTLAKGELEQATDEFIKNHPTK